MNKIPVYIVMLAVFILPVSGQLKPGDPAPDFTLTDTGGNQVSLSSFADVKGVILVFTNNDCPFSQAYESRMVTLHNRYAAQGFPLLAINPNDEAVSPEDSFEKMKQRAIEKGFPYPYLQDRDQTVCHLYGASRTPQVFLLLRKNDSFQIYYTGAFDDNVMDPSKVGFRYVEQAIISVFAGRKPDYETTRAVGCTIKSSNGSTELPAAK